MLEGGGLGAAGGKNIQEGEIAFGVGGAVERDLGVGRFVVADWGDEGVVAERASASRMRSMGPQSIIWMGGVAPGWRASSMGATWAM